MDRLAPASRSVPAEADLAAFAHLFRREIAEKVEYSYTALTDWLGVMIVGQDDGFSGRLIAFARANPWIDSFSRLRSTMPGAVVGFRVDARKHRISQYTAYFRPVMPMPWKAAQTSIEAAIGGPWHGPDLGLASAAFRVAGPVIVGLRGARDGEVRASAYFSIGPNAAGSVTDLAQGVGIGLNALAELTETMGALGISCPSVVGVDSSADAARVLKLDAPSVSLRRAADYMRASRSGDDGDRIIEAARSLRRTTASYVGLKLSPEGIAGWKIYLQSWPGATHDYMRSSLRLLTSDHPAWTSLRPSD